MYIHICICVYIYNNQSSQCLDPLVTTSSIMKVLATVTIVFILFQQIKSQTNEGDNCNLDGGSPGVCTLFSDCLNARIQVKQFKIRPTFCGFKGLAGVVCCPRNVDIAPTTTTKRTYVPSNVVECEYPPEAIKVSRNNQLAWNKCIDLADSVFPCKRVGYVLNSLMMRTDTCKHTAKELIFGGEVAKSNEFPHMAALGYDDESTGNISWECGGTLISDQWVMTAAHCIYNRFTQVNVKYVKLGGENRTSEIKPEYFFDIIQIVKHPDYFGKFIYNDIALLKLDRKILYDEELRPACLHVGNEVSDQKAIATGWGTTEGRARQSNELLKVTLDKFTVENCRSENSESRRSPRGIDNATQICYGSDTEIKDTCQGDSGGPLQIYNYGVHCTYTVIGITSIGRNCGVKGTPGIYTRVSYYVPWIESVVWSN
ncbi:trypsin-like [Arctopsyche grandis]|uniref:trypsin-like n=1 Tax=Arctopsyche grandis TaxID=121162 RepID=UPI00406D8F12